MFIYKAGYAYFSKINFEYFKYLKNAFLKHSYKIGSSLFYEFGVSTFDFPTVFFQYSDRESIKKKKKLILAVFYHFHLTVTKNLFHVFLSLFASTTPFKSS